MLPPELTSWTCVHSWFRASDCGQDFGRKCEVIVLFTMTYSWLLSCCEVIELVSDFSTSLF